MKRYVLLTIAILVAGATATLAQDVRYDYDKDKDFSKFKTYKWVSIKDADKPDDLTSKRITDAVDAELATKGLTKTDGDTADLYLAYQTAIGTEKQFTSYNTGWGYGPGWGGGWYGYGGGMSSTTTYGSTSTVYIGQLDLSMYDPATQTAHLARGRLLRPWTPRPSQRRKKRTSARLSRNYSRTFHLSKSRLAPFARTASLAHSRRQTTCGKHRHASRTKPLGAQ